MKTLNDHILAGLQSQLQMACSCDNESRIKVLREEIAAIQRENNLRDEMGLLPSIEAWQTFGSEA